MHFYSSETEEKLVLQSFVTLDGLAAGLVLGPVDVKCFDQATAQSVHTVLLYTSISTLLKSVLKDQGQKAQGQRRQGHSIHSQQRPLEVSGPSTWPTDLKI